MSCPRPRDRAGERAPKEPGGRGGNAAMRKCDAEMRGMTDRSAPRPRRAPASGGHCSALAQAPRGRQLHATLARPCWHRVPLGGGDWRRACPAQGSGTKKEGNEKRKGRTKAPRRPSGAAEGRDKKRAGLRPCRPAPGAPRAHEHRRRACVMHVMLRLLRVPAPGRAPGQCAGGRRRRPRTAPHRCHFTYIARLLARARRRRT